MNDDDITTNNNMKYLLLSSTPLCLVWKRRFEFGTELNLFVAWELKPLD
jgi:hypothetical protein